MDGPADTLNYMIAGYAVIFTLILGYAASLWLRWKRLRREEREFEEMVGSGTDTSPGE